MMKEHGDNGSTTTRGLPPGSHISSDKLIRDQELQHLVTSSIPSPPYGGLSLINASAALTVFGADPIYSTHLLATLAASNPNARFQFPNPIPLALQFTANHHHTHPHHQRNLFHHLPPAAVPGLAGLPAATLPNAGQFDILTTWATEQANKDDRKITSTTPTNIVNNKESSRSKNKRNNNVSNKNQKNLNGNNLPANKPSKRTANGNNRKSKTVGQTHDIVVSSENVLSIKKEKFEKEPEHLNITESIIQPFLLPLERSPVSINDSHRSKLDLDQSPPIKGSKRIPNHQNGNNGRTEHSASPPVINNNITKNPSQTSPGSNGPRDKVFTCPTCKRCFGYKHVLQNHERTHTGEKPFECNICMKKFTRDHHLKTHMRLHTGEKPYQCTHCDRQFVQVANLRRHLRVHTGERPYACELCSSRFSDSNQLKAHMLIHKGEKPYSCSDCGGQYRRRHHLAHHKCVENNNKRVLFHPTSSSPDTSPPQLTPGNVADISVGNGGSGGGGGSKRGRKCRETRRIIRLEGLPVKNMTSPNPFLPGAVVPEQTQPEDLSMSGNNTLRSRHYSGSSSSVTASSPSPHSGGSHTSLILRPYCNSNASSETPDLYSDEDRAADSSTTGKNESSSDDILSLSHE